MDQWPGDPERTVTRIGAELAGVRSRDEVVAILRRTARAIAGADGIAVVLREDEVCHYVAEDAVAPLWRGCRFPITACISGWAMLHDETVVVPDIAFDPRVPLAAYRASGMRSLVMVPIGSPAPVAALGAYWCATVFPDPATVGRIASLASHAARALSRLTAAIPPAEPGLVRCAAE